MVLVCPECNMTFNSAELLKKHQRNFCVGSGAGNVELMRRTPSPYEKSNRKQYVDFSSPRSPSVFSQASNSSMSLPLSLFRDDDDSPEPDPERAHRHHQLRLQAGIHGRQLALYKSKSKSLELQKEEIDRRLNELERNSRLSHTTERNNLEKLQNQEIRNQEKLAALRSLVKNMDSGRPAPSNTSFLAEIISLRQLYLRQGGSHPGILSQLAELEAEARLIEESDKLSSKKKDAKYESIEEQLLAYELENQRLHQELIEIRESNNKIIANKAKGYVDEVETERLRRRQNIYRQRLDDLENEIELLKRQAKLANLKKELHLEKPVAPVSYENNAEVPVLLQPSQPPGVVDIPEISHGPYDPMSGFVVFYDFVSGLDPSTQAVRLIVSLYNKDAQYGQPSILPKVYCDDPVSGRTGMYSSATVTAKQPVPRCPPSPHLYLIVELQVEESGGRLTSHGWCRINLFDSTSRLRSGRFRVPFRIFPVRPGCSSAEYSSMPQYGVTELFLRIVHHRDTYMQSVVNVSQENASRYIYPPQVQPTSHSYVPPPPSVTPPVTPDTITSRSYDREQDFQLESCDIGFQVVRVKNAEHGQGKVRITAYYHSNGHIVQSETSPVTASTNVVMSNFKYKYHVFGDQEAVFHNVHLQPDIILVVRFYLQKKSDHGYHDVELGPGEEFGVTDDEDLVAWASMPLMSAKRKGANTNDLDDYQINVGTHTLSLYEAPLPEVDSIPLRDHKPWPKYDKASVKINIFVDTHQSGSLTPSEESELEEDCPEGAWLPYERPEPPSEPYHSTDGFDLYIDGCRYLPDCVTFTRIAGRILTRKYERISKDLNSGVQIDSDIYNPVYDYRVEIREPNIPPTATLLLKVYTMDRFTRKLTLAGFATLNIFVQTGSSVQPPSDTPGMQISLNEGCHQLRLYQSGPDGTRPLYGHCLRDAGIRYIPCASILVRLYKAPVGPDGTVLQADKVPQSDWIRLGLYRRPPKYTDQVYQSIDCKPTHGECQLLKTQVERPKISLRESLELILEPSELRRIYNEKDVAKYIKNQLWHMMDVLPVDINLTYIAKYSPSAGIKFALDRAVNLPWSNFTYAHYCLNPPGAFYQGKPYGAYDKLAFTQILDHHSTNKAPAWKDGFKHFRNRSYHKYLAVIIHLQEVQVIVSKKNYKYGLLEQAWTVLPVFSKGYAYTSFYQLPLFHGGPKPEMLTQLAQQPVKTWIKEAISTKKINLVRGASVFVRIADGRRDDELLADVPEGIDLYVNTELLPENHLSDYNKEKKGRILSSLMPQGKDPEEFFSGLSEKFKSLVYKLYEDNNVNKT